MSGGPVLSSKQSLGWIGTAALVMVVAGCSVFMPPSTPRPEPQEPTPTVDLPPTPLATTPSTTVTPSDTPKMRVFNLTVGLVGEGVVYMPPGLSDCHGLGSYSDIAIGMRFDIRTESGDSVAGGRFDTAFGDGQHGCQLTGRTAVPELPVYVVDLGRYGSFRYLQGMLGILGSDELGAQISILP